MRQAGTCSAASPSGCSSTRTATTCWSFARPDHVRAGRPLRPPRAVASAATADAERTGAPGKAGHLHARGWRDVGAGPHLASEEGIDRLGDHLVARHATADRRSVESLDVGGPQRNVDAHPFRLFVRLGRRHTATVVAAGPAHPTRVGRISRSHAHDHRRWSTRSRYSSVVSSPRAYRSARISRARSFGSGRDGDDGDPPVTARTSHTIRTTNKTIMATTHSHIHPPPQPSM